MTDNQGNTEEVQNAEVEEVTQEQSAEAKPQEKPEDKRMFQDEDILNHVCTLLNNALNLSRDNNFQPVGFQFSELELIQRAAAVAVDRTRRINSLALNLSNRDKALATNLTSLGASLGKLSTELNQLSAGVENAKQMAQFFLPEDQKVK